MNAELMKLVEMLDQHKARLTKVEAVVVPHIEDVELAMLFGGDEIDDTPMSDEELKQLFA